MSNLVETKMKQVHPSAFNEQQAQAEQQAARNSARWQQKSSSLISRKRSAFAWELSVRKDL